MSKVICDVCGTSYPETSAQCPICGCVHAADAHSVADEGTQSGASGTYHYVKGGRFSKANVRKRNAGNQNVTHSSANTGRKSSGKKKSKKSSSNTGLIITIIVLLLAILAVVGYIIVKFFLPTPKDPQVEAPDIVTTGLTDDPVPVTDPVIPCEEIVLGADAFALSTIGEQISLNAVINPADTTDTALYLSSDEAVASVDKTGTVTAVDYGEAVITVSCGDITVHCNITVAQPFVLDTDNVVFDAVGTAYSIYSGTIALDEITWTSDNIAVAVVADGVITAVGDGTTTVYGIYKDTKLSCAVTCDTTTQTETTEQTAPDTAPAPYTLKNLVGGSNSDVTLKIGEQFSLALMDANGNKISDVSWTVKDGSSCTVSGGLVKAVSIGRSVVVASYNGQTFECIVRVN